MKKFNIEKLNEVHDNPQESAELIGLKYVNDDIPGINRIRKGKIFTYDDLNGKTPKKLDLERIKKLRIPPAWQEVWISPYRDSHLQATGIDKKGQKQYIYHHKWQEFRGVNKFL